jgi:hypothetical protein
MSQHPNFPIETNPRSVPTNFWELLLRDEELSGCNNLEKLVTGCEIIAALDQLDDLLAA